jgi:hypothetical protein
VVITNARKIADEARVNTRPTAMARSPANLFFTFNNKTIPTANRIRPDSNTPSRSIVINVFKPSFYLIDIMVDKSASGSSGKLISVLSFCVFINLTFLGFVVHREPSDR